MNNINQLFQDYPNHSKVWVFQADRELTENELNILATQGDLFTAQWKSHGAQVKATSKVLFNHFYVFISNEEVSATGGCSIDTLMKFVQNMGSELGIDFFNRMLIAYWNDQKIEKAKLSDLKLKVNAGEISDETYIFNNAVVTLDALKTEWQVPIKHSFLKKMLKTETIV